MADRNQLRIHRESEIEEKDPLTELTRIMGLEPYSRAASLEADDLGIDLEKELMGEFEAGFDTAANDREEPAAESRDFAHSQPADEPYESFDATLEEMSLADEPAQEPLANAVPADHEINLAEEFDTAFDDILAEEGSAEDIAAGEPAGQHDPEAERGLPGDLEGDFDDIFAADDEVWQPEPEMPAIGQETAVSPAVGEADCGAEVNARGDEPDDGVAEPIDIDFSGQLSPVETNDSATEERAPAAADEDMSSFEDDLRSLLGAAGSAAYESGETAAPSLHNAAEVFDAGPQEGLEASAESAAEIVESDGVDLESEYHAPADVDIGYETPASLSAAREVPEEALAEQLPEDELSFDPAQWADFEDAAAPVAEAPAETEAGSPETQADDDGDFAFEDDFDFDIEELRGEPEVSTADAAWHDVISSDDYGGSGESLSAEVAEEQGLDDPREQGDLAFDESAFAAAIEDELSLGHDQFEGPVEAEAPAASPDTDPLAALATMGLEPIAEGFRDADQLGAAPASMSEEPSPTEHRAHGAGSHGGPAPAPEIDTVEVPEKMVALADDLDIPELAFEEDVPQSASYDDLDAEFSHAFDEPSAAPTSRGDDGLHSASAEPEDMETDFDRIFEEGDWSGHAGAVGAAAIGVAAGTYASASYPANGAWHEPARASAVAAPDAHGGEYYRIADDEAQGYDPAMDGDLVVPHAETAAGSSGSRRRGFVVAAVIAGVAVAGGVGAFALSFGGGDTAVPVIVKAEQGPVKVKPENPGGVVVPNQDGKVYERVAGGAVDAPSQEKLISSAEEPVDIPAVTTQPLVMASEPADEPEIKAMDSLPGVDLAVAEAEAQQDSATPAKAEDRVEAAPEAEETPASQEIAAVAPRKVRTMIVRPDGTLVPREDPTPPPPVETAAPLAAGTEASTLERTPAPRESEPATSSAAAAPVAAQPAQPQSTASDAPGIADNALPAAGGESVRVAAATPAAVSQDPTTPARVPIAPSRPGDQPVDIVGEVKARNQVASLEPQPATAAAAGWSMQIASQPTPEGAQTTYQDLARRYGSVLDGRGVNIVKAEIAGKGTYWRVRVPTGSRNEAIQLCNRYKAAGGNCFVSQ